jgi:hypothetical protein
VPTFNDPNDRIALNTLAECFPERTVDRHPLHGLHLGARRSALHDTTGACLMDALGTKPWPPPPDIESIRELVRAADPEGHLAEGAHAG